jgi:shikimate dehydrogenase
MRALVLGAGGSARAAVWALLDAGAEVGVWNRTHARACELAEQLGARAVRRPEPADLLVNCTSVGLDRPGSPAPPAGWPPVGEQTRAEPGLQRSASDAQTLNQLLLNADQVGEYSYVVDLVYRNEDTPLIAAARARGAHVIDGLQVLVAQGARSFELWTGRPAPLQAMRRGANACA